MKTIIWIDVDREIPGHGLAIKGQEKSLPDDLADAFVHQKQAKAPGKVKEKSDD